MCGTREESLRISRLKPLRIGCPLRFERHLVARDRVSDSGSLLCPLLTRREEMHSYAIASTAPLESKKQAVKPGPLRSANLIVKTNLQTTSFLPRTPNNTIRLAAFETSRLRCASRRTHVSRNSHDDAYYFKACTLQESAPGVLLALVNVKVASSYDVALASDITNCGFAYAYQTSSHRQRRQSYLARHHGQRVGRLQHLRT